MFSQAYNFVRNFYDKNLFERLILYLFLSQFLVKAVFELGLGQWSFSQSQNLQWIFYGFLAFDYLVSYRKIITMSVPFNGMTVVAYMFFLMVLQGLCVGIIQDNAPFVILNDTVPLLMIGLNILRMQSLAEKTEIDFNFILKSGIILTAGTCICGLIGQAIGYRTEPSVAPGPLFYPLLMTAFFVVRPLPKWFLFCAVIMFFLTLPEMNRTSMAFVLVSSAVFLIHQTIHNPVKGILVLLTAVVALSVGWAALPKDSKAYARITGLGRIDFRERTGSIGEREAEWDAIQKKLVSEGETVQWLGLGFGGLYEFQSTHMYVKHYGHAHYAWAWFNLRFGKTGYFYMAVLLIALAWNGWKCLRNVSDVNLFIALLCLISLIYCFTYINFVYLLNGIQFLHRPRKKLDHEAIAC